MTTSRLYLLGTVRVERGGHAVMGFRSQKAQALLGYLAVVARPVSRSTLADLFWGDQPAKSARRELRRVLHNLNTLLPGCLEVGRRQVQAAGRSALWVDACRFWQLAAADDEESEARAVDLYHGELMQGLKIAGCPEFETWLLGEQERFRQEAIGICERLLARHKERADYQPAVALAQRCLAIAPWREATHRQLMLFLARTGQFSAALQQYERCRAILAAEIGVRPAPATVMLAERIRQARAPRRAPLPPDATPFVGRHNALATLRRHFADPEVRLITITGLGGMGKTRLALAAAREAVAEGAAIFLNGACWVSVAAVSSAAQLPALLARELRLEPHDQQTPEAQLLGYLSDREMLLVLDNYEHLLPATGLLTRILQRGPEVTLLVTSRERLNLQAEVVHVVDGLDYPEESLVVDEPEVARRFAAVRFAESVARRVQLDFQLAQNVAAVVDLCRLVRGMPLALELAIAWLPTLGWTAIAAALRQNQSLLTSTRTDLPARHRSWHAVFNHSWAQLGLAEREMLARLAPFLDDLPLGAVLAVGGDKPVVLRHLVEKSLIRRTNSGRYTMHMLLRQFVLEESPGAPTERRALERQIASFFAAFVSDREVGLMAHEQAETLPAISRELANIRAAWRYLLEQGTWDALDQTSWPLALYFTILGWFREGAAWFEQAVARLEATDGEPAILARCLLWQSFFTLHLGLPGPAHTIWRRCQGLASHFQTTRDKVWYELVAGEVALEVPGSGAMAVDEATTRFSRARQELAGSQRSWLRGYTLLSLGRLVSSAKSEVLLHEARSEFRALENHWGEFLALSALGDLLYRQGRLQEASAFFEAAGQATAHFASRWARGATLYRLGRLEEAERRPRAALAQFDRALQFLWESGELRLATEVLRAVVRTSLKCDDIERARLLATRNLALAQELGDPLAIAGQTHFLGHVLLAAGEYSAARHNYRQALAHFDGVDAAEAAWATYGIGQAAFYEGVLATAREYLERSLAMFEQQGSPVGAATAAGGLARLHRQLGDVAEALRCYEAALPLWLETNDEVGVGLYLAGITAIKHGSVTTVERVPLLAAAQRFIDQGPGEPLAPAGRQALEEQIAAARDALEEVEFTVAWKRGVTLSVQDCVAAVKAW